VSMGASAIGLDFPDVVAMARRLVPEAEFQEGDATQLQFPDNTFDAIVCGYGILHVPDPETVMQEILRVLRPGGRAALSVWDNEMSPNGLGLIYKAAQAHADLTLDLPHGPSVFQFSTLETMRSALSRVGFAKVEVVHFEQGWRVESGKAFLDALQAGTVRTRAILAAQTVDVLAKIAADFEMALADLRTADGLFNVPMPAIIGSGAKP
jgi:SAM-dependent methyltransferase